MSAGHITFFVGQCPMSDGYFDPCFNESVIANKIEQYSYYHELEIKRIPWTLALLVLNQEP